MLHIVERTELAALVSGSTLSDTLYLVRGRKFFEQLSYAVGDLVSSGLW
jgi:hypothetical protein